MLCLSAYLRELVALISINKKCSGLMQGRRYRGKKFIYFY